MAIDPSNPGLSQVFQAGAIQVEELMWLKAGGDGLDVKEQMNSIVIYEDIYSPFITGQLTMFDTLDLPGLYGRSGRDLLWIKMYTPGIDKANYIQGYFVIYKMGPRVEVRDRAQMYTLHFASVEMLNDMSSSISKTFEGAPNELVTVISKIYLQTTKPINVEPCSNKIKYTSNFWSGTRNLQYISSHATSSKKNANLMFYENRDGFNFKSMDTLAGSDAIVSQTFDGNDFSASVNTNKANKIAFGSSTVDPMMDYHVIQALRVDVNFDFLRDYNSGLIKTRLYSHDLPTKKMKIRDYDLSGDSVPRYNTNKIYTDPVVASMDPKIMTAGNHYGVNDRGDMSNLDWLQKRIGQISQFMSATVEIDVFGRTDYTVGRKVYIQMNRDIQIGADTQESTWIDRYYSGFYLITAISHRIDREQHLCTLELSKNGTTLP